MNKFVKKSIFFFIYVGLVVGLIYGIPRGMSYLLKTPYPMASITSGSMWPSFKKGDLVFIKGISSKNEVALGDVIVYENELGFTIHRVVELKEDTLVTRGDANNISDVPISYDKIVGKALVTKSGKVLRIPKLGLVSVFAQKK